MTRLFALFLLCFLAAKVQATHIVGGNLHYEYLGDNEYRITLKVYRDCATSSTNFDDPASIGIFNASGTLVQNVEIPLSDAIITDVPVNTGNACLGAPEGICVKEAIFSKIITLPDSPGGYTLAYQRCCRNTTLVNTTSNDDLGMTLYAEIPDVAQVPINSNPEFNEYPPLIICLGQPFVFDHSATDAEGDVLVYEFCNPLLTNEPGFYINPPGAPDYPNLVFDPGFSYTYPIASDPAFTIDPNTGLLTGTPNMLGQYVVGICVSEYRNGELISTTNRDFQFNVAICDMQVVAAIPEQTNFCDGLTVDFQNNSLNATSYLWDFGVEGTNDDTSTEEEPTFVFPDTGLYVITLIANPGTICADTAIGSYSAFPVILPEIEFGVDCDGNNLSYDFSVIANADNDAVFNWNFGSGSTPNSSSQEEVQNVILNPNVNTNMVEVTVTDNGCVETASVIIDPPPPPEASIVPQESFCAGFTYTFESDAQNTMDYEWNFGAPGGNNILGNPATFTFPNEGVYTVTLVASAPGTCNDTTSLQFAIYGLLDPFFAHPSDQCFDDHLYQFTAQGASGDFATYAWDFGAAGNPSSATTQQVLNVTFDEPGTYPISLTISENGCTETFTDTAWVAANPVISTTTAGGAGCPPLTLQFEDSSISESPLLYYWQFSNGVEAYGQNPTVTFMDPGTYDVTLTISTQQGCIVNITQFFGNTVQVYMPPIADFDIEPNIVDILNPVVYVVDETVVPHTVFYTTSDGDVYTDFNFLHEFSEAGHQYITLFVTDENGCVASAVGYVDINGFIFFAPNAFTPDNDGINDVWIPESTGITEYTLQIFNRWGDVIFETNNPNEPWLGQVHEGEYFAQNEVYVWHATMKDLLGLPHERSGHVTVVR